MLILIKWYADVQKSKDTTIFVVLTVTKEPSALHKTICNTKSSRNYHNSSQRYILILLVCEFICRNQKVQKHMITLLMQASPHPHQKLSLLVSILHSSKAILYNGLAWVCPINIFYYILAIPSTLTKYHFAKQKVAWISSIISMPGQRGQIWFQLQICKIRIKRR